MKIVGLTGGIASGKSTVAGIIAERGYKIIDADRIAWQLAEPGKAIWQAYYNRYGAKVLNEDKSLNRQVVADIVFADKSELEWMNGMAHPLINKKISDEIQLLKKQGEQLVFVDVPLLFESGWDKMVDETWLVFVSASVQTERLMKRNGFSLTEAKKRIASQMSLEEKRKLADVVINNEGSLAELRCQIKAIL